MFLFPTHLIRSTVRAVVGWLDDRGQAPIMRQHINDGTHTFRADEDEYRGITGVDEVLGLGAVTREDDGDPDAHVDHHTSLLELQQQYVAANKRTVGFLIAASLSIAALLGMNGVGPLHALARIVAGTGHTLVIGAGVVAGLCCWRGAQSAVRAVRLDRLLQQRRLKR